MKATNSVERKFRHEPTGTTVEESWEYKAENGHAAALQAQSCAASPRATNRSCASMRNPSPEFFRIYRFISVPWYQREIYLPGS